MYFLKGSHKKHLFFISLITRPAWVGFKTKIQKEVKTTKLVVGIDVIAVVGRPILFSLTILKLFGIKK